MNIQDEIQEHEEPLEQEVRSALADDPATIAQEVRSLTLRALTEGKLERGAVQRVVRAVVAGATLGAQEANDGHTALKEAMQGLDEALAAAAQATRLTLEEAIANAGAFSRQTLLSRMEDLSTLESLFIETVSQTASSAAGFARSTLNDVADHSRASGSAVGLSVKEGLSTLGRALAETVGDQVDVTAAMLQKEAALMASITSGVLRGIADRLCGPDAPVIAADPGDGQGEVKDQEAEVRC